MSSWRLGLEASASEESWLVVVVLTIVVVVVRESPRLTNVSEFKGEGSHSRWDLSEPTRETTLKPLPFT